MTELQYHGGQLDNAIRQFGGTRDEWLDLSTGISPISYPLGKIAPHHWQRLPDSAAVDRLIQAARDFYQVRNEFAIVCANGTQAIISQLPFQFEPTDVAVIAPTYNEHFACWNNARHKVQQVGSLNEAGAARVVVLVNPNNPDGRRFDKKQLLQLASQLAKKSGTLVVDEAFCDCDPHLSILTEMLPNCIVLRSFGKFFGLAGIRLGFAVCSEPLAGSLLQAFGPWNVSGPALYVGAKAMADMAWIQSARKKQITLQYELSEILAAKDFRIVGSTPLYAFAQHPRAEKISLHLKSRKILVRDFPSIPDHLRFGLCADGAELLRLDRALSEFA